MRQFLLYFGCWDQPGHFLYRPDKMTVSEYSAGADLLPHILLPKDLDGSRVFLPQPERVGVGQLTHLIRGAECVTVLAWWDRTFDQRGKCNAAIQTDGWDTVDGIWKRFCLVYETLAKQLSKPQLAETQGEKHGN